MNLDLQRAMLFAAGALLFLSFGFTEMMGSDLWWHLAAGRELVQTKTLWMVDYWSFPGEPRDWLNHEWLADLVYIGWVQLFPVESLVYWKWLVLIVTYGTVQWVLYRETGSPLAALLCAALAMAIAEPFLDIRPHIYSLLNYALLLALVLRRHAPTWLLMLFFLLWVNLHGGFFFGLMALGILLFPWRDLSWHNFRAAFLVGLACVVAAAVNPSGFKTFLYPLTYAFDSSSPYRQLGEWLPPFQKGGIQAPLFAWVMWLPVLALAYLLPAVRKRTHVPWEGIALTALTLAMALTSRRFIPLFGISLAVLLAPLLGVVFQGLRRGRVEIVLAVAALALGIYRLLPYPLQAGPAYHYLTAEYSYPVDMVNFMLENDLEGDVYALYNWGGYLHWRSDGGFRVFIDGRADTIYDAETYYHYVSVLGSKPGWIESIEDTGAQFVLWPYNKAKGREKLGALLETGRWVPVYRDSYSWLLARRELPLPPSLQSSPPSPWRDLTNALSAANGGRDAEAMRFVESAREAMPWHKGACQMQMSLYRRSDRNEQAEQVLQECRGWFPSRYLR